MTPRTPDHEELLDEVVDALGSLGLAAHRDGDVLSLDGARVGLNVVARAHPTPADLAQFVAAEPGRLPAMVVADRISEPGRDALRRGGWGWLDRRGHLRIWTTGLRVESAFDAGSDGGQPSGNPWTTVGLEVALAAMLDPDEPATARRLAPRIERSVGSTHEQIRRFTELGLIGPSTRRPLMPELFWETAAHWPDDGWTSLPTRIDELASRVGPRSLVRVDERAATLGGAKVSAIADLPPRFYVPDAATLRRARPQDRSDDDTTRCWLRVRPVSWLPLNDDHPPDDDHPWSVAHPLVCALRLAADPARGREIVEAWNIVPGES